MGADQKVGQNPIALAAPHSVRPPDPAGQKTGRAAERFDPNIILFQEIVALALSRKVRAELGVHDVADNQRATARRVFERPRRNVAELFVGQQNALRSSPCIAPSTSSD